MLRLAVAVLLALAARGADTAFAVRITVSGTRDGAYVAAVRAGEPWRRPAAEGLTEKGTVTFRLPAGSYEVVAGAPGAEMASRRLLLPQDRAGIVLELRPEQTIGGAVSDADGNPIAGARITQVRPPLSELGRKHLASAWTTASDEHGAWQLAAPSRFAIPLLIEADGFAPVYRVHRPQAPGGVDVTLRRGGRLALTLDRSDPRLAVTLRRRDAASDDDVPRWRQPDVWRKQANAVELAWSSLAPGEYEIVARSADPADLVFSAVLGKATVAAGETARSRLELPVPSPRPAPVVWFVPTTEALTRFEGLRALEKDRSGAPREVAHDLEQVVDGIAVYLDSTGDVHATTPHLFLLANASLPRADAQLRLRSADERVPLPAAGTAQLRDCERSVRAEIPVRVGADGAVDLAAPAGCRTLVLRFEPFGPVALARALAAGRTTWLGEFALAPAAGAEVRVVREPAMGIVPGAALRVLVLRPGAPPALVAEATAGDDGRASLTSLPAGEELVIEARQPGTQITGAARLRLPPGERAAVDPLRIPQPAKLAVSARLSEQFRLDFPEATIFALVLNGDDVVPRATRNETVGERGEVVFDDLRPGTWRLMAVVNAGGSTQPIELGELRLASGEEKRLDREVAPLVFRGRVTSGGEGVAAELQIWTDAGGRPAKSRPSGEFTIVLPEPGRHPVTAVVSAQLVQLGVVDFGDPAVPVELRLPGGGIEARVRDGGRAAAGVSVSVALQAEGAHRGTMGRPRSAQTGAAGSARIDALLEGTWIVEARHDGRVAERVVRVAGDEITSVTLDLAESAALEGVVQDAGGAAVSGARLSCLFAAGDGLPRFVAARTDHGGRFAIPLAAAPPSVRCGVASPSNVLGLFTTAPVGNAVFVLPEARTGMVTVSGTAERDTLWLVNAEGGVFNLTWAGRTEPSLTLAGITPGTWQLVRAATLSEWAALARGATAALRTVHSFRLEPGQHQHVDLTEKGETR